jgi:hypothetical protein
VTSVGISVPASSLFGTSGTPVTTSGTLGLTTTGTSGGIPYFFDGNTLKTSAALTANLPVFGGGAGATPFVGTRSGNTTQVVTTTGAQTSGDCVKIDASGNHIANGSACGGGGSLTVTDGTNTVTSTTSITLGTGFIVGGSAGAATVDATAAINTQSANSAYALVAGDAAKTVNRTNTVTQTDLMPQATGSFGSGFSAAYQTSTVGNTLTATTSTLNGISGATGLKIGAYQGADLFSDGANYRVALGLPQPATQTGTTFLRDDMTWPTIASLGANPTATAGTSAVNGSAATFMRSDGAPAIPAATTSTAGLAKLHNVPVSLGWIATVNPNNTVIAVINQASTISAIIGAVEVATGGTSTVSVNKAPSGTACSAGTTLHSSSFNANGTAATNQTLTVTTASLAAGDRLCLVTTGTTAWTAGTGIGAITVFLAPS